MKRVILDTNIYGRIIERKEEEEIQNALRKRKDVIIYGFDVVRKELRGLSGESLIGRRKLRILLLTLYDTIARTHIFLTTSLINQLAEDYYSTYRHVGGNKSKDKIFNDFLIIACASLHELDIVVSEDNKTMFSNEATSAYRIVNNLRKYRMPEFISYQNFRRLFS
ncbi:MAG: hypothetical protein HYT72_03700 [Candidatus Aenigmarchaeota archaeon]|nr:hypothetical protein [Candidatus Aenigmarchaeota archaeon]